MLFKPLIDRKPRLARFIGITAFTVLLFSLVLFLKDYFSWGTVSFLVAVALGLGCEASCASTKKYEKRCVWAAIGFGVASLCFLPINLF